MKVLVIGAGQMGRGIAQLAAQADCEVALFDATDGVAGLAKDAIAAVFTKLVAKDRLTEQESKDTLARISPVQDLDKAKDADLVIEAIVERKEVKAEVFASVSDLVSPTAIIATNTSSLSVTELAQSVASPERFVGLHFFNPVPLMKLVEVIPGALTSDSTLASAQEFVLRLGHKSVRVADTPGFLVNHLGRAYVTEAFRLLEEGVASFEVIDRVMRDGMGFRMGPFELMDLTGLDVTHPATEAIHKGFYGDPRLRPSFVASQRVAGGLLGKKSGKGFYGVEENAVARLNSNFPISVALYHLPHDLEHQFQEMCSKAELEQKTCRDADLVLAVSEGEDPTALQERLRIDPTRLLVVSRKSLSRPIWEISGCLLTPNALVQGFATLLQQRGQPVAVCAESPGHIGDRILASVVNLAADIAEKGIAAPQDIDAAVKVALGYPKGPLSWADEVGAASLTRVLEALLQRTGDPRYRISPWMKRRTTLGVSLTTIAA